MRLQARAAVAALLLTDAPLLFTPAQLALAALCSALEQVPSQPMRATPPKAWGCMLHPWSCSAGMPQPFEPGLGTVGAIRLQQSHVRHPGVATACQSCRAHATVGMHV